MLRAALRQNHAVAVVSLLVAIALAWAWLLLGAGLGMTEMDMGGGQTMLMAPAWTPAFAALIFVMWAVMMAAMMLPSAAPTILLVDALARTRTGGARDTFWFTLGYLIIWSGFSLLATAGQWGLDLAGLLREDMASASALLAATLLIAAGLYQWTPWKRTCLSHCRAPFEFLTRHWRDGPLLTGLRHGIFCLGCCWVLMGLLFVGGLMNPLWIAALALLVLVEKLLPLGGHIGRITGLVLIVWGIGLGIGLIIPF